MPTEPEPQKALQEALPDPEASPDDPSTLSDRPLSPNESLPEYSSDDSSPPLSRTLSPSPVALVAANFSSLPVEVIYAILEYCPQRSLRRLMRVSKDLYIMTRHQIFRSPTFTSLSTFDDFTGRLEKERKEKSKSEVSEVERGMICDYVQHVKLRLVRRLGAPPTKGAVKLRRLRICKNLRSLSITGLDDLRFKHLDGGGSLRFLEIGNTSFRSLSHPSSPNLAQTLSGLRELTLSNVGLPTSEHFVSLLSACGPTLVTLSLSSVRDVEPEAFTRAFWHLRRGAGVLRELRIKNLASVQSDALPDILRLIDLSSVEFTTPLATFEQLIALPHNLDVLRLSKQDGESINVADNVITNLVRAVKVGHAKEWGSVKVWTGAVRLLKLQLGNLGEAGNSTVLDWLEETDVVGSQANELLV